MNLSVNRLFWVTTALVLLSCLVACSTSNQGLVPVPERTVSDSFSIELLDSEGTYAPGLVVTETPAGATASVSAVDAQGLTAAAFHLNYDAARFTPVSVEIGDFLGGNGETINLSLIDQAGFVPVGIAQLASSGVAPRSGDGLLARVEFKAEPFIAPRNSSVSPVGDKNKVTDLAIISQSSGTVNLHWTEINKGDYNNDGLVTVADLSPLGFFYNQKVTESADPERCSLADGNDNGLIEVGDITAIGQNYNHKLSGYVLYTDANGTQPYGSGITVTRTTAMSHIENTDPKHPIKYNYTADVPSGFVQFTVAPVDDADMNVPGPPSNYAEIVVDDDPPADPTNLEAVSNSDTGHKTVYLNWTPSPSPDVRDYIVERQDLAMPGLWDEIATVGSEFSSLIDDSPILQETPYTYRVHAVDFTDKVSGYATSDPVTPYFFFLPAPVNVQAGNEVTTPNAIQVTWDPPADDSDVAFYRVYNADTVEILMTTMNKMVTEFLHTGLTTGQTYNYYVVSVDGGGQESQPSNTAGTIPSEITEINITSLTTDKTTHCTDGSEPASNLAVTTDIAAESIDWVCSQGEVTGTGENVTWSAPGGATAEKVTITCTVYNGAAEDSEDIYLYLTDAAILTSNGENGGHFVDFDTPNAEDDLLECFALGGNRIDNRPFSYYAGSGNVVMFDRWESF